MSICMTRPGRYSFIRWSTSWNVILLLSQYQPMKSMPIKEGTTKRKDLHHQPGATPQSVNGEKKQLVTSHDEKQKGLRSLLNELKVRLIMSGKKSYQVANISIHFIKSVLIVNLSKTTFSIDQILPPHPSPKYLPPYPSCHCSSVIIFG